MPENDSYTPRSAVPRSAGPLVFASDASPAGAAVLFMADVAAATVFAVDVPQAPAAGSTPVQVDKLGAKLASLLGTVRADVLIRGMAVHPVSHAVYLSIARGRGAQAEPALVRAGSDGELGVVELDRLPITSFALDDAPAPDDERQDVWLDGTDEESQPVEYNGIRVQVARIPLRRSTITGLAWVDGELLVAGSSNEEFSSRLRRVPYPFNGSAQGSSLEIYHVDHGRYETQSPIRALIPFDGGTSVLATYTCTPVVHFPLADLKGGGLVRGRTVAELGPMNQPFSLVSYDQDGEEFLLVSGTRHPLLKIAAASIAGQRPLTEKMEPVGVPREVLEQPGVTWMASLDRHNIVVVQDDGTDLNLRTLAAASL